MELTLDEALKKGIEAHKAGQLEEADQYYTAILEAEPKHPDANFHMGLLVVGVGKVKEALPFFENALEANPRIAEFWLSYIDALIVLGRIAAAENVFDQAKRMGAEGEAFDQLAQRLDNQSADLNKGNSQTVNSDPVSSHAQSHEPDQAQLQSLISFYSQGQLQQALAAAHQLLEVFSNSVILHNIMGAVNSDLGQFDAAINNFKRAMNIRPSDPELYYNMGLALHKKGDLGVAIASYQNALKIKPSYAEAYNNMGIALKDKGDLVAAIDGYKKALNIKPDYAEAYNNMGIAQKDKGDLAAAIESCQQALKIKPDYAEAYNTMGNAQKEDGDLEAAMNSYLQALKLNPDYADGKVNMIETLSNYVPQNHVSHPIISANHELSELKLEFDHRTEVANSDIVRFFSACSKVVKSENIEIESKITQTNRRNSTDLNCKRHMGIFKQNKIIPKFCFGCYKIQVEPKTVIDLIKLFLIFENLDLKNNNTRKCMVELRPEISGFYKGLVYCSSLEEANEIAGHLDRVLKDSIDPNLNAAVKRGCSEYPIAFPEYGKINNDGPQPMNYNDEWEEIEKKYDAIREDKLSSTTRPTLAGLNLSNFLVIQNWLSYAKGIGDESADLVLNEASFSQKIFGLAKTRALVRPFAL